MTLYTRRDLLDLRADARGEVFPAEFRSLDMDQFIGGELSFQDWLAESVNTGIYNKVDDEQS